MLGGQPNHGWQLCFPLLLHIRGSDFILYGCSDLTIDEMVGPDALAVVRPTEVYLLDLFCSNIQFDVLLSPFHCLIFYILIYMF